VDEADALESRGVRLEEYAPDAPLRHGQEDGRHRAAFGQCDNRGQPVELALARLQRKRRALLARPLPAGTP